MPRVICPKCGRSGYLKTDVAGNNKYYSIVHVDSDKRASCYLGKNLAEWGVRIDKHKTHFG